MILPKFTVLELCGHLSDTFLLRSTNNIQFRHCDEQVASGKGTLRCGIVGSNLFSERQLKHLFLDFHTNVVRLHVDVNQRRFQVSTTKISESAHLCDVDCLRELVNMQIQNESITQVLKGKANFSFV